MPRYLVKDKYTYERKPQTDYTYNKAYWPYAATLGYTQSHNAILPLYLTETVATLGSYTFSAADPVSLPVSPEMAAALTSASALCVRVTDMGTEAGKDTRYRVSFFGDEKKGESFSFVGTAGPSAGEGGTCFSLVRMTFAPVRCLLETDGQPLTAALSLACVYNTLGEWGGQSHFYTAEGATLSDRGGAMVLTLDGGRGGFTSRDLPREAGGPYSMLMPRRNTVFMILRNPDGLSHARLSFTSETAPAWAEENSVALALAPGEEARAYYFNLSACPGCHGRLTAFRLEAEGQGQLILDGYSFEQEAPLEEPAVRILSCVANRAAGTLTVTGEVTRPEVLAPYAGGRLALYAGTMADAQGLGCSQETASGKRPVGSVSLPAGALCAGGRFILEDMPLHSGETTLLPYQLLLFAEGEGMESRCLSERFCIENYEDFDGNPYAFDLPDYTVSALDFGARGDAIHNDTDAIQAAIDHVAMSGGGRVVLPGSTDRYGRRYIVTSLLLRDYVELHLGDGAVLWQSQRRDEYPYEPALGHDGVIPGINWTHNLHVSNLPLLQGANLTHIKVTGHGAIRMMDVGSEEGVGMPGYAVGCYRRIHCIPLGLFCCTDVETRDFEILRSNNYHTEYNHCQRVYIANVRLHQVKCVSGDGFGMAGGQHIKVNRCFLQSNDDGIVMSCHYHDPRGILWWTNCKDGENSCRNITVAHCYLNSGGGKALAFITWGTSDPVQEREEISDVVAYDNCLTCVNPVGTWPDNPYGGKQPFDNTETDDYSPVKNVRIFGNHYEGNCTLGPIRATNVRTDCGVRSTDGFRNGDFSLGGMANWTMWPNREPDSVHTVIYADKEKGCLEHFVAGDVAAAQGLHLETGLHTFSCELLTGESGAELFVCRMPSLTGEAVLDPLARGEMLAAQTFVCQAPRTVSLTFALEGVEEDDLFLGIRSVPGDRSAGGYAVFDCCTLESQVDTEGLMARRMARFLDGLSADFDLSGDFDPQAENGKIYLHTNTLEAPEGGERLLYAREDRGTFVLEGAIRANRYDRCRKRNGFGYRFAIRDGGASYRELRFNEAARTLTVSDVQNGTETVLYLRPNFFFTSADFHSFRLAVGEEKLAVFVDGSQYVLLSCPVRRGKTAVFFSDMDASVFDLSLTE